MAKTGSQELQLLTSNTRDIHALFAHEALLPENVAYRAPAIVKEIWLANGYLTIPPSLVEHWNRWSQEIVTNS